MDAAVWQRFRGQVITNITTGDFCAAVTIRGTQNTETTITASVYQEPGEGYFVCHVNDEQVHCCPVATEQLFMIPTTRPRPLQERDAALLCVMALFLQCPIERIFMRNPHSLDITVHRGHRQPVTLEFGGRMAPGSAPQGCFAINLVSLKERGTPPQYRETLTPLFQQIGQERRIVQTAKDIQDVMDAPVPPFA